MATIASALGLTVVLATRSEILFGLAAPACLFFTSFVWGSSVQAARRRLYPPLTHLTRRQYAETWDSLATSQRDAYAAAAGQYDEHGLRTSANSSIANILELASVTDRDEVLEIGCGVGRIGRELASHCCTWTGADRSVKMLGHAADRLRELRNVRLVLLQADGLKEFEANSFDVVYFTNMIMHLDEMDRWRYVKEAFRVLRTGGRIFIDNIDLESDTGWAMFTDDVTRYKGLEHPPFMPRFSTAAELSAYTTRAGFQETHVSRRSPLVIVTAVKPRPDGEDRPAKTRRG